MQSSAAATTTTPSSSSSSSSSEKTNKVSSQSHSSDGQILTATTTTTTTMSTTTQEEDEHQHQEGEGGESPTSSPTSSPTGESQQQQQQQQLESISEIPILENHWKFWLDSNAPTRKWSKENISQLSEFGSVHEFWHCFRQLPSLGSVRGLVYLFKANSRPEWEDPENQNGGSWTFRMVRRDKDDKIGEQVWQDLVVAVIGEQFTDHLIGDDDICGISMSPRSLQYVFCLWNRNGNTDPNLLMDRVRELVPYVEFQSPFYKKHDSHANVCFSGSSFSSSMSKTPLLAPPPASAPAPAPPAPSSQQ